MKQKFGIEIEFTRIFQNCRVIGAFPISKKSFLVHSSTGFFKVSKSATLASFPAKSCASLYIPEYKMLVAANDTGTEFNVFHISNLSRPIFKEYKTGIVDIFHMLYSKKSHAIVCFGSNIRIWRFNCIIPEKTNDPPKISITILGNITRYIKCTMLNGISFNYMEEILLIPHDKGLQAYNINGELLKPYSGSQFNTTIVSSFCPFSSKLITSSESQVIDLWDSNRHVVNQFSIFKNHVVFLAFVNKEFFLVIDSSNRVFLFNIKTARFYECGELQNKYERISFYHGSSPFLVCNSESELTIYKIDIPFKLWVKTESPIVSISRCNKKNQAARLVIFTKKPPFLIYSPKVKKLLATVAPKQRLSPNTYIYVRGSIADIKHDFEIDRHTLRIVDVEDEDVFIASTFDEKISVFFTHANPFQEINQIQISTVDIVLGKYKENWAYCFANDKGSISFYDHKTFEHIDTIELLKKRILKMHFHHETNSILVVFHNEMLRFDLSSLTVIERISLPNVEITALSGNIFLAGAKDGKVQAFVVGFHQILQAGGDAHKFHDGPITGFSFTTSFFISSSRDQTLKYWNYNLELIHEVWFPFPIAACEIMNGKRDVLIAYDNMIYIVSGKSIFGENVDIYESIIDNFDLKSDELAPDLEVKEEMDLPDLPDSDEEEYKMPVANYEPVVHVKKEEKPVETKLEKKINLLNEAEKKRVIKEMEIMTAAIDVNKKVEEEIEQPHIEEVPPEPLEEAPDQEIDVEVPHLDLEKEEFQGEVVKPDLPAVVCSHSTANTIDVLKRLNKKKKKKKKVKLPADEPKEEVIQNQFVDLPQPPPQASLFITGPLARPRVLKNKPATATTNLRSTTSVTREAMPNFRSSMQATISQPVPDRRVSQPNPRWVNIHKSMELPSTVLIPEEDKPEEVRAPITPHVVDFDADKLFYPQPQTNVGFFNFGIQPRPAPEQENNSRRNKRPNSRKLSARRRKDVPIVFPKTPN